MIQRVAQRDGSVRERLDAIDSQTFEFGIHFRFLDFAKRGQNFLLRGHCAGNRPPMAPMKSAKRYP